MSCRHHLVLLAVGLTLAGHARAQVNDDILLRETRDTTPAEAALREALPKAPGDAPVTPTLTTSIEIVTRHFVYQLTEKIKQDTPGQMARAVDLCERKFQDVFGDPQVKNTVVQEAFHKKALEALNRVLANPQQSNIVRINAARLLSRLAALSVREETAESLVKVVAEPTQAEGARFYGCQGLKELQARLAQKGSPPIKDATRRTAVVTTLIAFVERKPPFSNATPEELDGLRYMRREGIRALAEARAPQAALTLARIAGKDSAATLEPRLDERVEATIGLCLLPADPQKELQMGYVAQVVGQFLKDFGQAYDKTSRLWPWKLFAARLNDALKNLATHDDPNAKSVANLGKTILDAIEQARVTDTGDLDKHLKQPGQQRSIYKSDEKSFVTPKAPAREGT